MWQIILEYKGLFCHGLGGAFGGYPPHKGHYVVVLEYPAGREKGRGVVHRGAEEALGHDVLQPNSGTHCLKFGR